MANRVLRDSFAGCVTVIAMWSNVREATYRTLLASSPPLPHSTHCQTCKSECKSKKPRKMPSENYSEGSHWWGKTGTTSLPQEEREANQGCPGERAGPGDSPSHSLRIPSLPSSTTAAPVVSQEVSGVTSADAPLACRTKHVKRQDPKISLSHLGQTTPWPLLVWGCCTNPSSLISHPSPTSRDTSRFSQDTPPLCLSGSGASHVQSCICMFSTSLE